MEFTFEIHPAAIISANHRLHWAQRSRLTADLRARAAYAWRLRGQPQMSTAHCVAHLSYPDRRHRDADNLAPTMHVRGLPEAVMTEFLGRDDYPRAWLRTRADRIERSEP